MESDSNRNLTGENAVGCEDARSRATSDGTDSANRDDEKYKGISEVSLLFTELASLDDESGGRKEKKLSRYESWYTVNIFLFFLASFQLVNLLTLSYTDSVLNFIADRFRIPYTMASFIPSSYQVGNTVAVLPVSYFGAKWHRPRAICVGVMVMLLGLGFCILPHFIMPPEKHSADEYQHMLCTRTLPSVRLLDSFIEELREDGYKHLNITNGTIFPELTVPTESENNQRDGRNEKVNWFTTIVQTLSKNYHLPGRMIKPSLSTPIELPCNANGTVYNPSVLLIIGHAFIGMGSSPLWPLGVAYLDDHLVNRKIPLYLGIFIGTTLTGPVAGFLLGSLSSAIYVTIDSHNLKPTDPAWIGAWWLGYVVAGLVLVVLLVPFYFFPESLPITEEKRKEREEYLASLDSNSMNDDESVSRMSDLTSDSIADCGQESIPLLCPEETSRKRVWKVVKDLLCSIRRVLSVPVVLCSFIAYIVLANLLSGVATFGSTYLEKEFNVLRITSDMLIGGVCVPLAIAGTFGGGFCMKKFNFNINQSIMFNVLMSSVGTAFISVLFGLGCEMPVIAGINHSYLSGEAVNVTSKCNKDCLCANGDFNLICSASNITYLSPCYAGCMKHAQQKTPSAKEEYSDCSCVDLPSQPLVTGSCSTPSCAKMLAGTMIAAALGIMILCFCQAPTYTILLRGLRMDDKPLAIGLLTFLSRILGFIPAPIWFASVIDKGCIYWGPTCKGKAVCKLYNNRGLRINYVGACLSCSLGYVLTFAVTAAWFSIGSNADKLPPDDEFDKIGSEDASGKE